VEVFAVRWIQWDFGCILIWWIMKYTCYITETNYGQIEVEADNKASAEEIAYDKYCNGETMWGDVDYTIDVS